jgi:phytoene desaturase
MMNQDGQTPLFYANFPSLTDKTAAPEGMESAFSAISSGINDTEALREEYFDKIMNRFESVTKQSVKKILYLKSFCKTILCQNTILTKEMRMEWQILCCKLLLRPKLKKQKKFVTCILQDS